MKSAEMSASDPRDKLARPSRLPRAIGLACSLLVVGAAAYFGYLWLAPPNIYEGPLLQRAEPDSVTLVWYLSKAAECEFDVSTPDGKIVPHTLMHDGLRYVAAVAGLTADTAYKYEIRLNRQTACTAALHTAKRPGQPFDFVVFGDSGRGSKEQYRLAAVMAATSPDFLLHTGDLVYPAGKRSDYHERFFKPYAEMTRSIAFWPCLGNHDIAEPGFGAAYREVFELPDNGPRGLKPEHNYWFDYASARIAVLDSNLGPDDLEKSVAPWLRSVFQDSNARWKFVAFHHPPYTTGKHQPSLDVQRALVPAFEAVGVDVVFCGHDHLYERTRPLRAGNSVESGGVTYIVSGAGGAELYETKPPADRPDYFVSVFNEKHSFTLVTINGDALVGKQITIDGRTIDDWTIIRPPGIPTTTPTPATASAPAGG